MKSDHSNRTDINLEGTSPWFGRFNEVLFCACLFIIFIPAKIYPFAFLLSSCFFLYENLRTHGLAHKPPKWGLFLSIFTLYATGSFFWNYQGESQQLTNIIKLWINAIFLYCSISWMAGRNNTRLLKALDITLYIIFALIFVQLIVYHWARDFSLLLGASSSNQGSILYHVRYFFWGLIDKNMFGARIALLGFTFILMPMIRFNKVQLWRIVFLLLLAYLSLSRTPIVALLIGVLLLVWAIANNRIRLVTLGLLGISLPFIAQKLLRVEHLTSSNDGMGIRLTYWKAFFSHFEEIPITGRGFMKGGEFLSKYAAYYRGEPHAHNAFISFYLELGVIGLLSYIGFLVYFIMFCKQKQPNIFFWLIAFTPLLAIMMILYSGYDNDIIMYLLLIYVLGAQKTIQFKSVSFSL